jgi:cell division protein FtsW
MTMMIIGRVPIKKLMMVIVAIVGLVVLILCYASLKPKAESNDGSFLHRVDVWVARIDKFTSGHDEVPAAKYDFKANEQVGHANIAIATSSILGKGPGNSVQRDFLSEAASDFIFAIIIEEMGLVGGIFVVFLYLCLLIRAGRIAKQCDKTFPALLVIGIALLMVSQALVNMLVAVGLFPVTGQPLPLISKGGTSTLINCVYIGMMLSISNYTRIQQQKKSKSVKLEITNQTTEPTAELLNEDTKMK